MDGEFLKRVEQRYLMGGYFKINWEKEKNHGDLRSHTLHNLFLHACSFRQKGFQLKYTHEETH